MDNVIELKDVRFQYKGLKKEILRGISFSVTEGQVFGFLGPNGAGKTTTIKAILGLIRPDSGSIYVLGKSPQDVSARQFIGYMPEIAFYYWYLTPRELLYMYGKVFNLKRDILRKRIEELLHLVGLEKDGDRLMKGFSKGMMQKVSFAQALINDPKLLILDEPTGGLDPIARLEMRQVLKELKGRGKTIFFSSHELSEVEMICDGVAILKEGELIKVGPLDELLKDREDRMSLEEYFLRMIK